MAYQFFLQIPGQTDITQFESFSFAESVSIIENKRTGPDGKAIIDYLPGPETLSPLTLTRQVDTASLTFQKLFQAVVNGDVRKVQIDMSLIFQDPNGNPYLRYIFTKAFVSGIATSGNRHGGNGPEEQIQITFDSATLATGA